MDEYRPYSRRLHENFRLCAGGVAFDVDAFLAASTLKPDHVVHQGEQRSLAATGVVYDISGFEIVLGDGLSVPFREQQSLAADYLEAHGGEFRKLRQAPGLEDIDLYLEFTTEFVTLNTTGFGYSLNRRLMNQCVAAGVCLHVSVSLIRSVEDAEPGDAAADAD